MGGGERRRGEEEGMMGKAKTKQVGPVTRLQFSPLTARDIPQNRRVRARSRFLNSPSFPNGPY